MFIKQNLINRQPTSGGSAWIYEIITATLGLTAAIIVATKQPQPWFGIAFWLYVIGAFCGILSNYKRGSIPYVLLFTGFLIIDSYGVYNWWPFNG